jgi:hypothetical protein
MRKLTIALTALTAIAVPALAEAASQQRQATPVASPVSTTKGASSSKSSGPVISEIVVTKRLDKASYK